ncbi:MAG TPA: TPM domain-containing protein [Lacipirellulaceae bacterium]|jgi:uncharacterized protein|nr:TPM domain-containing protein [Lacipirellulaceae bacterium]
MAWLKLKRLEATCLLVVAVILAAPARQAAAIPSDDLLKSLHPTADVNDFAALLTPAEKASLEARCRQLRERTGAQLSVVTLKSLEGGNIEDFSVKLFKRWGIGQKDQKNGVLLIVAMDERLARIETGYGIEPIIPDILAARIIDNQLKPQFRNHQYEAGLRSTVNAICELIEKGTPADRAALANQRPDDWFTTVLFLCIFVGFGGFALGLGSGIPQIGFALFGLFFGGMATALGYGIGGNTSLAIHLPLAIMTALAGFKLAKQGGGGPRGGRRYGTSGWNWGSFPTSSGGWSSGGWSSGGGGFSQDWGGFGGGSSGGGGATGSW